MNYNIMIYISARHTGHLQVQASVTDYVELYFIWTSGEVQLTKIPSAGYENVSVLKLFGFPAIRTTFL
jgi:hypothetical protein